MMTRSSRSWTLSRAPVKKPVSWSMGICMPISGLNVLSTLSWCDDQGGFWVLACVVSRAASGKCSLWSLCRKACSSNWLCHSSWPDVGRSGQARGPKSVSTHRSGTTLWTTLAFSVLPWRKPRLWTMPSQGGSKSWRRHLMPCDLA